MKRIVISLMLIIGSLAPTRNNAMEPSTSSTQRTEQDCAVKHNDKHAMILNKIKSMQESISNFLAKQPRKAAKVTDSFIKILKELTEFKKQLEAPDTDLEEIELIVSLRENELKFLQRSSPLYARFISGINATSSLVWYFSGSTLLACITSVFTQAPQTPTPLQGCLQSNTTTTYTSALATSGETFLKSANDILPKLALMAWVLYNILHDVNKS